MIFIFTSYVTITIALLHKVDTWESDSSVSLCTVWAGGPPPDKACGVLYDWLVLQIRGSVVVPHHGKFVVYDPSKFTNVSSTISRASYNVTHAIRNRQ